MKQLVIELENCYGIKHLAHTFDFSKGPAFAIYAPNGTMKSSLALTFSDVIAGRDSRDRISPSKPTKRRIADELGTPIPAQSLFVIPPYDPAFETEKVSILLVNPKLRKEYEALFQGIEQAKASLIEALKKQAQTKIDVDKEILEVFGQEGDSLLKALQRIRANLQKESRDAPLKDIEYDKVFDQRVSEVLETEPIKSAIEDYIKRYDELLSASVYFRKGKFTYYDGEEVAKSLGSHGFFGAGHRVIFSGDGDVTFTSDREIQKLIQEEKDRISEDPEIRRQFAQIDKALKKNVVLRSFESYLCDHKEILPLLTNVRDAKKAVWRSYFNVHFDLLRQLVERYEKAENRRRDIERQAARERTQWEAVVEIFTARFFVPFTLSVSNKVSASLGTDAPSLQFTFEDGTDRVAINRDDLVSCLSQGERKALYILNVIFEVEARKHAQQETLFVIDDIADSFDYKNKYAIVQYLRDIADVPHFRLLILTHNFDFFRTVQRRFVAYDHCLMTVKTFNAVRLEIAEGIKNIFVNDWKKEFFRDAKKHVACIPFLRNLIEYTRGESDPNYKKLTSLLHWKADTLTITQTALDQLFVATCGLKGTWPHPNELVYDQILETARRCLTDAEGFNFENKIVLSIAIRLVAERYMVEQINDNKFWASIEAGQGSALLREFKKRGLGNDQGIKVLEEVELMTPENIHLNSFMYEPIIDMSDEHLRRLFRDVEAL